ncbi:ShlB/FhaC/HecB family hemolysin secretion/activation protein [Marinobacter sp. F4216]|uniref:ShlB/FhaC/HecB family hemolysin secretion/activation protein n=1 Tax=Marinobacter sp. F4216 TaxID=2874281 RepID=UPI001CBFE6DE|nr:ShlB/FhaC/HecB family hemolysin secretion/activation protein [Marinobacter sp. F4216]MBZ2167834.1 hypothetical protein [Marinobacter sp. F4216]
MFALLWCVLSGQAWATSSSDGLPHWLQSRVELSGASEKSSDNFNGHLNLNTRGLFFTDHVFGVKFKNGVSRLADQDSDNLGFSYGFPMGSAQVGVEMLRRDFEGDTTSGGERFNHRQDQKSMVVSVARPLFTWNDLRFKTVVRHASEYEQRFEAGSWDESANEERSSLTVDAYGRRDLPAGFSASTRLAVSAGSEFHRVEDSAGVEESSAVFQKASLSSSISRPLNNWLFALDGHYQIAPSELPGREHVVVASSSMISGLNGSSLSSPEGGWLKLKADSPLFKVPGAKGVQSKLQLAALRGWIPGNEANSGQFGRASSVEASLQLESRNVETNLSVGRMVESSGHSIEQPDSPDFSLSVRVTL